ncbi:hypothetical protein C0J52_24690 [Blattella germanica]|nr:hypothetical protein C0J52_24690 [Blattella germanica]
MKMSSSMYEVFHWNSTPEPTSKPTQRAKSLSYAPGSEPKTTPDKSDPHRTAPEVPTELNLNLDGRAHSFSSAPHTPSNRSVRIGNFLPGYGGFPGAGEETDSSATGAAAAAVLQRVNRRKTDLMPTIPSPRDLTPTSSSRPSSVHLQGNRPFSRSPGRAYSMSRLDQLSQPRRRPAAELAALHEKTPTPNMLGSSPTTAKSMSRSMSHLASGGSGSRNTQRGSQLRRSDASRSMSQLSGSGQGQPVPLPRMTRAERLRQRAREMAVRNITGSTGQLQGLRSGEITPTPPSRPLSALSQQSMNSVNSGVSLRARPAAASRRPRPFSIAVTGVSHESDSQATRTSHRHSIAGDIRTPKAQSSSIERESAKPPLPKASPRVTPKATPLQSPGSEAPPPLSLPQEQLETKDEVIEQKQETEVKTEEVSPEKLPDTQEQVVEVPKPAIEVKEEIVPSVIEVKPPVKEEEPQKPVEVEQKETKPIEPAPVQEESLEKVEALEKSDLGEPEVDMSETKCRHNADIGPTLAYAECRRIVDTGVEKEEEKRLEEERLRQEEEEQRRFEEEQLRLVEEARRAEEERLLQAIEENQRREEEERKRREEEAKARAEKEESERKAREEAERLRREMDERLKKEEEERIARRKRVEAIMLRTRGKGSTPSNASAKGDGDNEEGKDESPMEETKPHPGDGAAAGGETQQPSSNVDPPAQSTLPATSDNITGNGQISQKQQSLLTDTFSSNIMDHIQENGGSEKKVSSSSSSDLLLIDNSNNVKPMETSEDLISSATSVLPPPPQLQQSNGHRNGMEYGAVDFVSVDNV